MSHAGATMEVGDSFVREIARLAIFVKNVIR